MTRLLLIFLVPLLFFSSIPKKNGLTCKEIIVRMLDSVKIIKTQKFDMKATEHVGAHLLFAASSVKINTKPEKIYIKSLMKGIEILWVEGENNGNAKVHSRSIPLINFDLDPYGSVMRKDQHHTIFEVGFGYVAAMVANTMLKSPQDFDTHFSNAGILIWDKKECYQIVISYPEYKYVEYIAKKGETVASIAKKFGTNDFKLRSKNDLSSYFGTIKEGKKILIPTPYSNKGILLIDKKTFLPINVKIYDEEGLFEAYEFYNIRINQTFMSDEFLKSYKDYAF